MSKNPWRTKKATTEVDNGDGSRSVIYHQTRVVTWSSEYVILDDGGRWRSPTTKSRMNQVSRLYDLGFSVYQRGGEWFVEFHKRVVLWELGWTVYLDRRTMQIEQHRDGETTVLLPAGQTGTTGG